MPHESVYDDPLIYDILMTPGTAGEADVLERIHARHADGRTAELPWLEPACGSGRLLRVLANRGRRLIGYDASPAMLDYARGRLRGEAAARVRLALADMRTGPADLRPGACGFAFNPWNTLRHLPDDEAVLAHLEATAAALHPGGRYVVGISLTDPGGEPPQEDVWSAARGRCRVTQVVNYLPPDPADPDDRVERVLSHVTVTRPGGETHHDAVEALRSYTPDQWDALLEASPWRREARLDMSGKPLPPGPIPYALEVLARRDSPSPRGGR
ncbi:MAG TPA: methyltransferase domain-containing protein [Candidatus Krumholzibacteria bacterium]|nr:methyltransferase domain-containing protein [Candidatus Krumholzibacteria bacterium]HRX51932.1 methyltransferase domain-containing protein [Candidatus Krumholzibacteria bacterium]